MIRIFIAAVITYIIFINISNIKTNICIHIIIIIIIIGKITNIIIINVIYSLECIICLASIYALYLIKHSRKKSTKQIQDSTVSNTNQFNIIKGIFVASTAQFYLIFCYLPHPCVCKQIVSTWIH